MSSPTSAGVGLALIVTVTTAASCYCWAIKKRELGRKRSELFRRNGGLLLQQRFSTVTSQGDDRRSAKIFSAEELKTATNNYEEGRILGRGGHGTVYKGIRPDQTVVAIKKSKVFDESNLSMRLPYYRRLIIQMLSSFWDAASRHKYPCWCMSSYLMEHSTSTYTTETHLAL
jgi:hypothetical protein